MRPRFHARRHIAALDGLRGIAVLFVLVYHGFFLLEGKAPDALVLLHSGLWSGVDLFFVLSGFLITGILLDTRDTPGYFRHFYLRRALRIFPLYYGVLIGIFAGGGLLLWAAGAFGLELPQVATDSFEKLGDAWGWLMTYTVNFLQAAGPRQTPGLGHFWSLAIEEQFYLVWPLFVYLVPRRYFLPVALVICLGTLALRCWLVWAEMADYTAIRQLTYTRWDTLVWGGIAAFVLRERPFEGQEAARLFRYAASRLTASLLLLLAIGGAVSGSLHGEVWWMHTVGYSVVAVAFAAFVSEIVVRDADPEAGRARWLEAGWLVWLGKLSYGAYVFHWPLTHLVRYLVPGAGTLTSATMELALLLALTLPLSWASWVWFERLFLRLKKHVEYRYHDVDAKPLPVP